MFVAMSFDARHQSRWDRVLLPALGGLQAGHTRLSPFRVDLSKASDAILSEILAAIGDAHCVVADISAVDELDGRPIRNANVMYEVGIAHAARLPEEVILFRSDTGNLDFDIAGIRVHHYDPDGDTGVAIKRVRDVVVDSMSALDERRRITTRWAADRLTLPAMTLLLEMSTVGRVPHPASHTMGDMLSGMHRADAIGVLLELGALKSNTMKLTPELLAQLSATPDANIPMLDYSLTTFGQRLIEYTLAEMGIHDPILKEFSAQLAKAPVPPPDSLPPSAS